MKWISPSTPVPGFSSLTMEFPESELAILAQVAAHSKVKTGNFSSNGFPASVMRALEAEELNLTILGRVDSQSLLSKALRRLRPKTTKRRGRGLRAGKEKGEKRAKLAHEDAEKEDVTRSAVQSSEPK